MKSKAKRIAKILKIDFKVIDLRKEFKKLIIELFFRRIKKRGTPLIRAWFVMN
jgi:tRNA U34 2-thiouridine synthase MnmA/TrmU